MFVVQTIDDLVLENIIQMIVKLAMVLIAPIEVLMLCCVACCFHWRNRQMKYQLIKLRSRGQISRVEECLPLSFGSGSRAKDSLMAQVLC